jgi:hypothetical protein
MRAFAIRQLDGLTSCVDRIVNALEFDVEEWLKPAYTMVCTTPQLIADEDIDRLGLDVFKKIARARDTLMAFTPSRSGSTSDVIDTVFFPSTRSSSPIPLATSLARMHSAPLWPQSPWIHVKNTLLTPAPPPADVPVFTPRAPSPSPPTTSVTLPPLRQPVSPPLDDSIPRHQLSPFRIVKIGPRP